MAVLNGSLPAGSPTHYNYKIVIFGRARQSSRAASLSGVTGAKGTSMWRFIPDYVVDISIAALLGTGCDRHRGKPSVVQARRPRKAPSTDGSRMDEIPV
jgi:hypothetical protein